MLHFGLFAYAIDVPCITSLITKLLTYAPYIYNTGSKPPILIFFQRFLRMIICSSINSNWKKYLKAHWLEKDTYTWYHLFIQQKSSPKKIGKYANTTWNSLEHSNLHTVQACRTIATIEAFATACFCSLFSAAWMAPVLQRLYCRRALCAKIWLFTCAH